MRYHLMNRSLSYIIIWYFTHLHAISSDIPLSIMHIIWCCTHCYTVAYHILLSKIFYYLRYPSPSYIITRYTSHQHSFIIWYSTHHFAIYYHIWYSTHHHALSSDISLCIVLHLLISFTLMHNNLIYHSECVFKLIFYTIIALVLCSAWTNLQIHNPKVLWT